MILLIFIILLVLLLLAQRMFASGVRMNAGPRLSRRRRDNLNR
jgi:hypothetical protein